MSEDSDVDYMMLLQGKVDELQKENELLRGECKAKGETITRMQGRLDWAYIQLDSAVKSHDMQKLNTAAFMRDCQTAKAEADRWHRKAMDAGVIVHSDGSTSHPMRGERDRYKAELEQASATLEGCHSYAIETGAKIEIIEAVAKTIYNIEATLEGWKR